MFLKLTQKFKGSPTLFYAMSIAASWAGVGSLMNSITMTHTYGLIPSAIWSLGNSLACIIFGLVACGLPAIRGIMRTKAMQYIIGIMSIFQLWINMNGIREIFADTAVGTKGGTVLVYVVCIGFILLLFKSGMIRNVLTDRASWIIVYLLVAGVTIAAFAYTKGAVNDVRLGFEWDNMCVGLTKGFLLLPGPFTYPYFYKLLDYNDANTDKVARCSIQKAFVLGGLLFGAYMFFTFALAWVQFSPVLNLVKAVLVSLIGISTISTFLYSEYIVFGKMAGLIIDVAAVVFWPLLISLGVMGVWTLMAEIRIYLIAVLLVISLAKRFLPKRMEAQG